MTRFEYIHVEGFQPYIYDVEDNHMMDDLKIICEVLNDLSKENEELKTQLQNTSHQRDAKYWSQTAEARLKEIDRLRMQIDDIDNECIGYEEQLERLEKENKRLKEKNRRLEFRTVDMLDFIKEKGTVTHQEMKDWWNTMMKGDVE